MPTCYKCGKQENAMQCICKNCIPHITHTRIGKLRIKKENQIEVAIKRLKRLLNMELSENDFVIKINYMN